MITRVLVLFLMFACAALCQIGNGTVAGLPAAASYTNNVTIVSDGATPVDCTTGRGSYFVSCRSNGSAWVPAFAPASTGLTTATALTKVGAAAGLLAETGLLVDASSNITGPAAGFSLIGGTGTTADLTLQTTSGVGTTGADVHVKVGNNGATEALTILNSGNVGIGTTSPDKKLHSEVDDATANAVTYPARLTHTTSGTAATGMGVGVEAELENASGTNFLGGTLEWRTSIATGGAERTYPYMTMMSAGVASRWLHGYSDPTSAGQNTFVGMNAGNLTMGPAGGGSYLGSYNSAVGVSSLYYNTTGSYNSAVGMDSLLSNTTGYYNSAVGMSSLYYNTTGNYNSAVGMSSLYYNTTGSYNSAVGMNSLLSNTTGNYNSALGVSSLYYNTTGYYNSAVGYAAGWLVPAAIGSAVKSNSSANLTAGTYYYKVSYVVGTETALSGHVSVATDASNLEVTLSSIPTYTGPLTCTARKVYRTKIATGLTGGFYLVATIADNTTTTLVDTVADASVGTLDDGPDNSIMLGSNAKAIKTGQFVVGADGTAITEMWIGEGVYGASPAAVQIGASGGSGTNNAGADLVLAGGPGTGSAKGGDVILKSSAAGGAGTGANALVEVLRAVAGGGIDLAGGTRPTCDSAARGRIVLVEGGSSTADTIAVCAKNSSDTYDWYALATIP